MLPPLPQLTNIIFLHWFGGSPLNAEHTYSYKCYKQICVHLFVFFFLLRFPLIMNYFWTFYREDKTQRTKFFISDDSNITYLSKFVFWVKTCREFCLYYSNPKNFPGWHYDSWMKVQTWVTTDCRIHLYNDFRHLSKKTWK